MVVKVLNTIPVPITDIKKPVIFDGSFLSLKKIISKTYYYCLPITYQASY